MDEALTYAMTNAKALAKCGLSGLAVVKVFNPLSQDQELMRPALLPSLMQVALTNINRGQKDIRVFELGKRYLPNGEKNTLAILLTGRRSQDWRANRKEAVDFFDLKGALEGVFCTLGVCVSFETSDGPSFDHTCAASMHFNGKTIGALGKISTDVLNQWDIKHQDIYFAEIDVEPVMAMAKTTTAYQTIPEFPAVVRDVSLAVKKEIPYANIEAICRAQGRNMLKSVQFIEQYSGDKIQAGHKGLVFSCLYQDNHRTLREEEVAPVHEALIQALVTKLGAIRR